MEISAPHSPYPYGWLFRETGEGWVKWEVRLESKRRRSSSTQPAGVNCMFRAISGHGWMEIGTPDKPFISKFYHVMHIFHEARGFLIKDPRKNNRKTKKCGKRVLLFGQSICYKGKQKRDRICFGPVVGFRSRVCVCLFFSCHFTRLLHANFGHISFRKLAITQLTR